MNQKICPMAHHIIVRLWLRHQELSPYKKAEWLMRNRSYHYWGYCK